jgi:hypothetical protein
MSVGTNSPPETMEGNLPVSERGRQVFLPSPGQDVLKPAAFAASQLLSRISLRIIHCGKNNLTKTKLKPGLFCLPVFFDLDVEDENGDQKNRKIFCFFLATFTFVKYS